MRVPASTLWVECPCFSSTSLSALGWYLCIHLTQLTSSHLTLPCAVASLPARLWTIRPPCASLPAQPRTLPSLLFPAPVPGRLHCCLSVAELGSDELKLRAVYRHRWRGRLALSWSLPVQSHQRIYIGGLLIAALCGLCTGYCGRATHFSSMACAGPTRLHLVRSRAVHCTLRPALM